jgi:multiple sugar transport system substrate-binding protein
LSEAPTATPSNVTREAGNGQKSSSNNSITLWVNETSAEHKEILDDMAADFGAHTGFQIEIVLVNSELMPDLVATAVISDTLPDLILHQAEYSLGWAQSGILDPQANSDALAGLGRETFDPALLSALAIDQEGDQVAAIPSDGWQHLIVYRSDWFAELGLDPPETYEKLQLAAESIYDPENNVTGLIVPTDASLITTQRVFEHLALANGCQLVDGAGKITLLHPACLEALEYYRVLVNEYSPIGFQTDTSAVNAYLAGRTGMIFASPEILSVLAGLDDQLNSSCPQCTTTDYLAKNSGLLTGFEGSGEFSGQANYPGISALSITSAANGELAGEFVDYWFNGGYELWLSIDPERKVPLRRGTPAEPDRFLNTWASFPLRPGGPTLVEVYDSEVAEKLISDLTLANRWGFPQNQGVLVSRLYKDLTLSPLLQEMLSGYFTSSQTIIEMYADVIDLIPDYPFPIEIAPSPTPE